MKKVVIILIWVVLTACTRGAVIPHLDKTTLILESPQFSIPTRASSPDETRITDCNILVFNPYGDLEERIFVPERSLRAEDGYLKYEVNLLRDVPYTVLVALNLGYALPQMTLDEARTYRYHMAYPDEYSRGLPMAALREEVTPGDSIRLRAQRLMARVDLQLDRRQLSDDIFLKVTDVEVGGSASSVQLFPGSVAEDVFRQGFTHRNTEVQALNRFDASGLSESVSLYVLENLAEGSYVEIKAEYHSDDQHTEAGERVTYRFDLPPLRRNGVYPVVAAFKQ